jgi:hypothetical protein
MSKGCAAHRAFYTSYGRLASYVFWLGYGTADATGNVQIRCRCRRAITKHITPRPARRRTTPVRRGQVMCSHCWNKLIVVSLGLAVVGVLMCAVALLDVFIPRGSIVAFLASMAILGLIVAGVVIGYTWACDKCEAYFNGRLDRLLSRGKPNRGDAEDIGVPVSRRPTEPRAGGDARSTRDSPQLLSCGRYALTLRGSVSPRDATKATAVRTWHGQ